MIDFTLIAMLTYNTRLTEALTGQFIASGIITTNGIAPTILTAIARHYIEVARLTFTAVATNNIGLTMTLSRYLITLCYTVLILFCAWRIASATVALTMWQGQRIAEMSCQTLIAVLARSIVYTLKTFAGGAVAIADGIGIHIAVTVAGFTCLHSAKKAGWVAEETIRTHFTTRAIITNRTLSTYNCITIDLHTGAVIGTGTTFAIVWCTAQSVAIIATCTLITIIACGIMLANAATRL